jgi:hypothetical protein
MSDKIEKALGRWPDFVIGDVDNPYLLRWYVIPRNRFFNIYLHKFCRSDDDRALHDHPWLFNFSILLEGTYHEHLPGDKRVRRMAGKLSGFKFRWGKSPHRVKLLNNVVQEFIPRWGLRIDGEEPVWTLFITGPKVREWGFYCPKGWRHWKDFVSVRPGGNDTGRGCE